MAYRAYRHYKNVGAWWRNEGRGKFPIQVPWAITKAQESRTISFHEAFEYLVDIQAIVIIDDCV